MTHSTPQPVGDRPDDLWAKMRAAYDAIMAERDHLRVLLNCARSTVSDFDLLTQIHQSLGLTTPATREDGASGADGERLKGEIDAITHRILPPANAEIYIDTKWRAQMQVEIADAILALRPLSPDQPSARERRLEEALRPFATVGALIDRYFIDLPDDGVFQSGAGWNDAEGKSRTLTLGDFRRARQALAHNLEGGR